MKFLLIALFATAASAALAPLHKAKERIDGSYIVMLKDGNDLDVAVKSLRDSPFFSILGGRINIVYGNGLNAFAANLEEKALDMIRRWDIVEYVEEDGIYRALAVGSWGLDRVDARSGCNDKYNAPRSGSGQTVYVVDTGIRHTHNEFGNRASYHWDYQSSNGGNDCNGHGTHCAGTVGGSTYGICKSCNLKSIRVLSCSGSGTTVNVIAGVNSIPDNGGVGSMSLGGGISSSLDSAVAGRVSAGNVMVVAAGNDNANACNYSPARESSAVTVGATGGLTASACSDNRASYSNYGSCLDIFAPGSHITSAWYTSDSATNTISGTSMACPHVAGAAALLRARGVSAGSVPSTLVNEATSNAVGSPGSGSPNKFLYVN